MAAGGEKWSRHSCLRCPLHSPLPYLPLPQVDVWAVGVLVYEMMMQGPTPFYHEDARETEKLIMQVGRPPAAGLGGLVGCAMARMQAG